MPGPGSIPSAAAAGQPAAGRPSAAGAHTPPTSRSPVEAGAGGGGGAGAGAGVGHATAGAVVTHQEGHATGSAASGDRAARADGLEGRAAIDARNEEIEHGDVQALNGGRVSPNSQEAGQDLA